MVLGELSIAEMEALRKALREPGAYITLSESAMGAYVDYCNRRAIEERDMRPKCSVMTCQAVCREHAEYCEEHGRTFSRFISGVDSVIQAKRWSSDSVARNVCAVKGHTINIHPASGMGFCSACGMNALQIQEGAK